MLSKREKRREIRRRTGRGEGEGERERGREGERERGRMDTIVFLLFEMFCSFFLFLSALEELYNSTNGANWEVNYNWMSSFSPCDDFNGWYGVYCNSFDQIRYLFVFFFFKEREREIMREREERERGERER